MSNWKVTETLRPNQKKADFLGNKFLTGNGHLGYRGTLAEYRKNQKTASIINGLYDQVEGKWREPINAPNVLFCQLFWKGEPLSALDSELALHEQSIDMKKGLYSRKTDFIIEKDQTLSLQTRRFVSLDKTHLLCQEYRFSSTIKAQIRLDTGILGDVWDINGPHLKDFTLKGEENLVSLSCKTGENGIALSAALAISLESHTRIKEETLYSTKDIVRSFTFDLEEDKEYTLSLYGAIFHGNEVANPEAEAKALSAQTQSTGFETALLRHQTVWKAIWKACDVVIEGDDRAQKALRFSLYHLFSLAPHHDKALSIAARGLSGQVYKGGIFWDTEMFMLPVFLHTKPELAAPLLRYRIETLTGAREKAAEYGYKGAFYAWESQEGGKDACTLYNVNNVLTGRPMRTFFRDKQIHISADIAQSFREYTEISGDETLLLEGGLEVMLECCRFYASWCFYKPEKSRYEFLDLTGPDEYHEQVNNDFFTNSMVKKNLESFFWALELLEQNHPHFLRNFLHKQLKTNEKEGFKEILNRLYLPSPDQKTGIIPQFDGYLNLVDPSKEDLFSRKKDPNEYLGGGEGLARWTQIIKQADVILVLGLDSPLYSREVKEKNFLYYEPRTEHGSSLSACAYAVLAAELGRTKVAYDYFLKTAETDIKEGAKDYVGDLYIGGTHPAANGGAWISLVRGFLGIRYTDNKLIIDPHLPPDWKSLSLQLVIRGLSLTIKADHKILLLSGNNQKNPSFPLALFINGKNYQISDQETRSINYKE